MPTTNSKEPMCGFITGEVLRCRTGCTEKECKLWGSEYVEPQPNGPMILSSTPTGEDFFSKITIKPPLNFPAARQGWWDTKDKLEDEDAD